MIYDTQTPYAAAYVIVQRNDGKIAFVLRSNTDWMNNYYGLPSGKVEKDESFTQAAIREAKEEIGIAVDAKNLLYAMTVHRKSTKDDGSIMEWVDVYFLAQEWSGDAFNAEPHMHSELAWFDPEKLPNNTIESVKLTIEQWLTGKKYFEYGYDTPRE